MAAAVAKMSALRPAMASLGRRYAAPAPSVEFMTLRLGLRSLHGGASSRALCLLGRRRLREHHGVGEAAWRRFCVRAADVSGPGSIDSLIAGMEAKIKEQLKTEEVIVKDAYGDGRHVSIDVVAEVFEGQSAVNRQRMVYKAIWEELQNAVHAVDQLKTRTPAEAASAKPQL